METENLENETPKNESEETLETPLEVVETPKTSTEEVNVEELKKQAELAKNYKVRAEKAEAKLKEKPVVSDDVPTLTSKDTVALINAKVNTEDFDSVVDWAKFKKVSVAEALKDKTLQVVLREKAEERTTANVTTTKGGRGFKRETPEEIVARASRGELPEDDEGIARLAEAHHALKMKGIQK